MAAQYQTLTRAQFLDRVATAKHGEPIRYHTGFLMLDKDEYENGAYAMQVKSTAAAAFKAAEDGHVLLVQRKLNKGCYEYIAVKQERPIPLKWTGCYDPERSKYIRPVPTKVTPRRRMPSLQMAAACAVQ